MPLLFRLPLAKAALLAGQRAHRLRGGLFGLPHGANEIDQILRIRARGQVEYGQGGRQRAVCRLFHDVTETEE
ncbi:MAG: hypothetical protein ACJ8AI_18205 [Rhodopila sp.]